MLQRIACGGGKKPTPLVSEVLCCVWGGSVRVKETHTGGEVRLPLQIYNNLDDCSSTLSQLGLFGRNNT